MELQKKTFEVRVQINEGLEPMALRVNPTSKESTDSQHHLRFEITRDKDNETLATLIKTSDHSWQLLNGDLPQDVVGLIGSAIDNTNLDQ